ncbi:hypothetical protein KBY93_08035 [Synechococcus sp. J7-Johnson]|uniref:hypothetical protein n=1 Tax=Synechococcus sp. J7-Johnson TaxID=2823737 RepID=UPI0020CDA3B4|nr:hypothetical protein [Synechococcus sp. J7-Johnson]MCP9840586.1 hypothetical protein [Synechococcus sp. J7-Johnson]
MIGLYDHQGLLRFVGRDSDDCLDYADLFGLGPDLYILQSLTPSVEVNALPRALSVSTAQSV